MFTFFNSISDSTSRTGFRPRVTQQHGAVAITVALGLLFLLGFMGIAIDLGRLFVVKSELQTAMDSCALAAAKELDGGSDQLIRAIRAGKTAGNLNKVDLQANAAGIEDGNITFSDALTGVYSAPPVANAKFVRCERTQTGLAPWLLQAFTGFTGNPTFAQNNSVQALGVATLAPAQTVCAVPVQLRPKTGGTAPNYGYAPGEWVPSLYSESNGGGGGNSGGGNATNDLAPGHFGWANLDGSTSASEAKAELLANGVCNLKLGSTIGSPGAMVSLRTAWNSRFGLYKNGAGNPQITNAMPDTTGYAYTTTNWPAGSNAINDFLAKRADYRSFGNLTDTINAGEAITGLNLPGYSSSDMGTHAAGDRALATHGGNRRLVLVPVTNANTVVDFACMLMLHPITGPNVTVKMEFVGNAAAAGSPCANTGMVGGSTGPKVPALVR